MSPSVLGPWPRLDRHGNVYWWQCLEPRCRFRTDPEARGGSLWWAQVKEHAATDHPDRDPESTGHADSLRGVHVGAPPASYVRGEGVCLPRPPTADEDEDHDVESDHDDGRPYDSDGLADELAHWVGPGGRRTTVSVTRP